MNEPANKGSNRPRGLSPAVSLHELRTRRGLSLNALQRHTGINKAAWSQIERGLLLPQPRHLEALSFAFGIPVETWRIRFVLEAETTE